MDFKKIAFALKRAVHLYIGNILIIWPMVLMFIFLSAMSILSYRINFAIIGKSDIIHYIWLAVFAFVSLLAVSCLISIILFNSSRAASKNPTVLSFKGAKYTFKSLALIIVNLVSFGALFLMSNIIGYFSNKIGLSVSAFKALVFGVYISGLLGFLIFLSFSLIILIVDNSSIFKSISNSTRFVRKNYLDVLFIFTVLFLTNQLFVLGDRLVSFSAIKMSEFLNFLFLYPLMALFFVEYYKSSKK